MPSLTADERILRYVLINSARNAREEVLSYSELGLLAANAGFTASYPMIDPPFRGLGEALGNISRYEHAFGRPLLSAIVVTQATGLPGDGFVPMAAKLGRDVGPDPDSFCRAEMAAVLEFWCDPDPTRIIDAGLDRILTMLRSIRRELK